jgi:flotillin
VAAEPVGSIDTLTVISTDGASQITRDVASNVAQGLQLANDITGLDVRNLLSGLGRNSDKVEKGAVQPPAPPPPVVTTPGE